MSLFNFINPFKKRTLTIEPKVAYLCDRLACKECHYPECKHTFDISHAKNFDLQVAAYFEREEDDEIVRLFPEKEVVHEI